MLDSRKTNPNCSLSEDVVSYVYDEMKEAEKQEFEQHLSGCSTCENELAAFSVVSTSVKEWRDIEFASLETPKIEIPYEAQNQPVFASETVDASPSWMDGLRAFFASFGMKTVAGFASLVVIFGLGWFLFGSFSNGGNIVSDPKKTTVDPVKEKESLDPAKPDSIDIAKENEAEIDAPTEAPKVTPELAAEKTSPVRVRKNVPTKTAYNPRATVKRKAPVRKNRRRNRAPSKKAKEKESPVIQAPIDRLTEEFAIDEKKEDELRLSDLFDEVGSDK